MNALKNKLQNKRGMTLVEVLVAMAILVLIVITFTPLFAQYYRNIYKAGEVSKNTYEKASLIERVLANKGDHINSYESRVSDVPLTMSVKNAAGESIQMSVKDSNTNTTTEQVATVSFGNSADYSVTGMSVTSDYNTGGLNNYATFYSDSEGAGLYCFPNTITDDFVTKDIYLVLTGGEEDRFMGTKDEILARLVVKYTDSTGTRKVINQNDGYYEYVGVEEDKTVLHLKIRGGNNVICFQNSPLVFEYSHYAPLTVEVGAPEIIMVGEKASDGKYYYYATKGVDEDGNLELVAKSMTDSATMTSAMNDVEWVAKNQGDDGNGGKNAYGYYVMGGDEGQVRRFWKNDANGNYYWGGDNTIDYYRNLNINANTVQAGSTETMTPTLTGTTMAARTSATSMRTSFVNIFKSNNDKNYQPNYTSEDAQDDLEYGFCLNSLLVAQKGTLGYHYDMITTSYFTANIPASSMSSSRISLANVYKIKGGVFGGTKYEYYGPASGANEGERSALVTQLTGNSSSSLINNLNVEGYIDATDYDYTGSTKSNANLITITSVGAISFGSNVSYIQDDTWSGVGTVNSNVYPTKSYTLYCGYIPAVMDVWGRRFNGKEFIYMGTLGIALSTDGKWYPTASFGDIYTSKTGLNESLFGSSSITWKDLLNYTDDTSGNKDTLYPFGGNRTSYLYTPGQTVNGKYSYGLALAAQGNDYYISNGEQVDVTIGYLSQPYATALNRVSAQLIGGKATVTDTFDAGSDFYFTKNDGSFGSSYDHSFFGSGQRDFVTMLDVKSYHDDLRDANFSIAVGYSLGFLTNDYSDFTRLGQVYNSGVVFLRATGNGENNDTKDSLQTGKGWSLALESNVFHQFYTTREYSDGVDHNGDGPKTTDTPAVRACLGWNTRFHRDYYNISKKSGSSPSSSNDSNPPGRTVGSGFDYGTNTHVLAQTECNCVNWGTTWDTKPQAMWGTENGTLMSWFYNYEGKKEIKDQGYAMNSETYSKSSAVVKEFESYLWADTFGSTWSSNKNEFYDYNSVNNGIQTTYGFISVLKTVNDIAFGGDNWVAAGDWSGKNPKDYCASASCYTKDSTGSYVNVKYLPDDYESDESADNDSYYVWKAVNFTNDHINIVSVTYCESIWYITGYHDNNSNGEYDAGEKGVIYYARNPLLVDNGSSTWNGGWRQGAFDGGNTVAYYYAPGSAGAIGTGTYEGFTKITLEGVNSMASQG